MIKIILLFAICFLSACSTTKKPNNEIKLDISKKIDDSEFSEFLDSFGTIQLETRKECFIGDIDQIFKDDTLLFILDKHQKNIFIFSDSGKFIRKIDHVGKAEGEYISTTSFCIDKNKKVIVIYDITQKKVLTFDYYGNFINEIKLFSLGIIRSIGLLSNGNLVCFTPDFCMHERDGVWEIDNAGNFLKQFRKVDPKYQFGWMPYPYYSNYNGKISFYDSFTNEVYSIKDDKLTCDLRFNLTQKLPDKYLMQKDGIDYKGSGNYFLNNQISENDNFYYFQFRSNELGDVNVFFEKKTKIMFIVDKIIFSLKAYRPIAQIFSYDSQSFVGIQWGENSLNPSLQLFSIKKI